MINCFLTISCDDASFVLAWDRPPHGGCQYLCVCDSQMNSAHVSEKQQNYFKRVFEIINIKSFKMHVIDTAYLCEKATVCLDCNVDIQLVFKFEFFTLFFCEIFMEWTFNNSVNLSVI